MPHLVRRRRLRLTRHRCARGSRPGRSAARSSEGCTRQRTQPVQLRSDAPAAGEQALERPGPGKGGWSRGRGARPRRVRPRRGRARRRGHGRGGGRGARRPPYAPSATNPRALVCGVPSTAREYKPPEEHLAELVGDAPPEFDESRAARLTRRHGIDTADSWPWACCSGARSASRRPGIGPEQAKHRRGLVDGRLLWPARVVLQLPGPSGAHEAP
jgi:hypothetical protein